MSFNQLRIIAVLVLSMSSSLLACQLVTIGGIKPTEVRELFGKVVGSGRSDLIGSRHDEERRSITIPGATISIKRRIDTKFFKKGEVRYPPGVKPSGGSLKGWKCETEVAEVQTDGDGNFAIKVEPGKYCLDITAPRPANLSECSSYNLVAGAQVCIPLQGSFIIDVTPSAPKGTLMADISFLWPDCSGGESLQLKPD